VQTLPPRPAHRPRAIAVAFGYDHVARPSVYTIVALAPGSHKIPDAGYTSQILIASAREPSGSRVGMNSWATKPLKPVFTMARMMAG